MDLVLLVTSANGTPISSAHTAGLRLIHQLATFPHAAAVQSPWNTTEPVSAALTSKDAKTALVIASITGGEVHAPEHAQHIADQLSGSHDGLIIKAGGEAMVYAQITHQSEIDFVIAEAIAIPFTFLVLVWVFGGLIAATLPLLVGGFTIAATIAILRAYSAFTEVSIFALNLTTAMGLALAIDYTLLIITRYREEVGAGLDRDQAIVRAITTAGRTVIFSAVTVGLSMLALAMFPMFMLRSFAYAGTSVVAVAAVAAIVVAPALIMVLGDRIDALNIRQAIRKAFRHKNPATGPIEHTVWYRWARFVTRRPITIGLAGLAALLAVGIPFLDAEFGFPDDRVLASSLSPRQVGDTLRTDFVQTGASNATVVVPDASKLSNADLDAYAIALSQVEDVDAVSAPGGAYVEGNLVGPPMAPTSVRNGAAFLTIANSCELYSGASEQLLDHLHAVPTPGGEHAWFTGLPQINRDSVHAMRAKLPAVLGFIAASTFVLLFLLTGSAVLPLQALVLNALCLSAVFGAMVWIFQSGHLAGLGTVPTGTLIFNVPMLLFCIAFGLSMDYEVFVVARIRECWLTTARTRVDNAEAVALGLAHTGRVVTAAALIMSIAFAALISSKVAFMSMLGFGLALSVLIDSTLVRATLVPAFMSIAGRFNWWAPKRVVRRIERWEIGESV
jgi:RND superfamily putative drug exporter